MSDKVEKWIGVDLDGTLAFYDGWISIHHIGAPIELMVNRVKEWLSQGQKVKIFTARVSREKGEELDEIYQVINSWSLEHIGQVLEVTCKKDFGMITLYDDRCIRVEANTGRLI